MPFKSESRINCFPPLIKTDTKILILGTIPGNDSIKLSMYYGNENNHFWDFIYRILDKNFPVDRLITKAGNKDLHYQFLMDHHLGLWDVISNCTREGSNDSKIKDAAFNKIAYQIKNDIKVVLCNGEKAYKYLKQSKELEKVPVPVKILGSTSTMSPTNTFKTLNQWRDEINKWL